VCVCVVSNGTNCLNFFHPIRILVSVLSIVVKRLFTDWACVCVLSTVDECCVQMSLPGNCDDRRGTEDQQAAVVVWRLQHAQWRRRSRMLGAGLSLSTLSLCSVRACVRACMRVSAALSFASVSH